MELQQIKTLRINATNIKSTLINSNKKLKKIRIEERNLLQKQRDEALKQQRESAVESKQASSGPLQAIGSRLLSGPMSLFDKIKEFFGNILLGILVNNLPMIYEKIQKFLDDNKNIIETIKTVIRVTGSAIMGFIDVFNSAKDIVGQLGNTISQIKTELDGMLKYTNEIVNDAMMLNSDVQNLDKEFKNEFKDTYTARTPDQVREDVKTEIKQTGTTKKEFTQSLNQYRTAKNQSEPTKKIKISGVGTYQRVKKGFWEGGMFGGTKEVVTDNFGSTISPQEFDTRFLEVAGNVDTIFQGYSEGGTVKPTTSGTALRGQSFSGESASARKARESTQSFSAFENNAITQSNIIGVQEENNKNFEEMIKKFKELFGKKDDDKKASKKPPHQPSPNGRTPDPFVPSIDVDPKEIVGYSGGESGLISSGRSSGPHIHIENGEGYGGSGPIPSSILSNIMVGGRPLNSYETYRDAEGKGKYSSEIHAGYDFMMPAGSPITLQGGLKFVEYDKAQFAGDNGNYGDVLIVEDANKKRYMLAHLSRGPLNAEELREKQLQKDPVKEQVGNLLKALERPGINVDPVPRGGGGGLDKLSQTFDDEPEVVMIMAQQPIIVPGQDRYIVRNNEKLVFVGGGSAISHQTGLRELV